MAGSDGSSVSRLCNYCGKNVDPLGSKCLKCVKCEKLYHTSCSQRVKTIREVNLQLSQIICCADATVQDVDKVSDGGSVECYRIENTYLKAILQEKEARIRELMKLNEVLENHIKLINVLNNQNNTGKQQQKIQENYQRPTTYATKTNQLCDKKADSKKEGGDSSELKKESRNVNNSNWQPYVNKQREVMDHVINLTTDQVMERESTVDSDGFQLAKTRKRSFNHAQKIKMKNRNETRGTAETGSEEGFKAKPSKMWFYIGRAAETVSENMVCEYIKKKCSITNNEQIIVKKLNLVGNTNAFQVGIAHKYYELLNTSEFWPEGIIVRRFRFKYNTEKSPGAFLGTEEHPIKA